MMYRVILVDDEPWSLRGIEETFPWELYGFEVICSATDPMEAFSFIIKEEPDVVFTDVNMPACTGIDMIKMVRERKTETLFVIISGYSDFKYVKEAIKYDLFDYCLKPIDQDEANELLSRIKKRLDEKNGLISDENSIAEITNQAFKNMVEYMNHNYMEKLTLNEMAVKFKFNPTYCCYLFNKNLKCSFSEYLISLRMKKALQLLDEGEMTTEEISDYLKYDYYYFNKVFKKYFHMTPQQYKRKRSI